MSIIITITEAKIMAEMLDIASERFSCHTCNDYELDATPENIEFVKKMNRYGGHPEDDLLSMNKDKTKIYTGDSTLMGYCKKRLLDKIS